MNKSITRQDTLEAVLRRRARLAAEAVLAEALRRRPATPIADYIRTHREKEARRAGT